MIKVIELKIDGKEIKGSPDRTILDVARKNGFDIPTLCYDQRLEPYGGCGLCVVEVEGSSKLIRACATKIAPGMVVHTNTPRVRGSRKLTLELLLSDHTGDCRPPCVLACPAYTDCQGYVGLIANKQHREAVALIKEQLPLPASIGRVCPHPCETACRRNLVDEPVSIADLKAFVGDIDLAGEKPWMPEMAPPTGKKVAVAGAGPAGLTAAYFLARDGHEVTVYDAMSKGGGMLRYGIPAYRLPKDVLDQEIDLIERMGVHFRYNTRIGRDVTLHYLKEIHDAVFVGIGAWESSPMRCKGEELPGVLGGIDFLREAALHGNVKIGSRIAVIGGGNTAMDAARTAVRLGAEQVMVLYRRTREEMPAAKAEIEEAEEEGVLFRFLVAPLEVVSENGGITTIRLQKMELGEPDESGRRRPAPIPGAEETIPVDTVIAAIGQKMDPKGFEGLEQTKWGTIAVNEETMMTGTPGIFAGGDAVTGPGIAIEAVAQGKKAAVAINSYLNGKLHPAGDIYEKYLAEQKGLTPQDFSHIEKAPRVQMPHLAPEARRNNFRELNLGISEGDAVAEAMRCLECGCRDFFECKLVKYARDYDAEPDPVAGDKHREKVVEKHPLLQRNSDKCILCGLCVRICDEVMGVTALGLVDRGFETLVKPALGLPLADTGCISCGQCAAVCPTGALVEQMPIAKNLPMETESKKALCTFCGMDCELVINVHGNLLARSLPPDGEILCSKGRFGFEAFNRKRLERPLVRRNGKLAETSWIDALKVISEIVLDVRAKYGDEALAVSVSPSYSLEDAGAAAAFGKLVLRTTQIGSFTPNTAHGLASAVPLHELESTDLILLVGSFEECRVAAVKARTAARKGVKLAVLTQKPTVADDLADLRLTPGNTTAFLKEVLAAAIREALPCQELSRQRISGFEELMGALQGLVPGEDARMLAKVYGQAKKAIILVDGHDVTPGAAELLGDLALLTGKTGTSGSGITVITPGANRIGLNRLGVKMESQDLGGALKSGKLQGIFIFGEDPVGAGLLSPQELQAVKLVVAVSPYKTPTTDAAHAAIPSATPLESGGTFIASDGSIRSFAPVVEQTGKTGKEAIEMMAASLGVENLNVMTAAAIKPVTPSGKASFTMPEEGCIFRPAPVIDPALRSFYIKLENDGLR